MFCSRNFNALAGELSLINTLNKVYLLCADILNDSVHYSKSNLRDEF